MSSEFLRFGGTVEHDPAIEAWLRKHDGELGALAREWFQVMRDCGDEVREVFHDGAANACFGDAPFAYVNIFTSHVNVGFFQGALLRDPAKLLQGDGKRLRHVKLRPGAPVDAPRLRELIETSFRDIKHRVENGTSGRLR